jgi:hypothetical protein
MENFETLSKNTQESWEKHCKIITQYQYSKNKWIVAKKCLKRQKNKKPKQQQRK